MNSFVLAGQEGDLWSLFWHGQNAFFPGSPVFVCGVWGLLSRGNIFYEFLRSGRLEMGETDDNNNLIIFKSV